MPSTGTLGSTLPSGHKSLKVKCQAFPQDGSTGLKWPSPASLAVTGNHHGLSWQVGLRISWLTQGYLLCPDLLLRSLLLPNLHHLGCYRINNYKKIHMNTSLLLGWTNIFPPVSDGPYVSYTLIGKRSFPAFKILQLLKS